MAMVLLFSSTVEGKKRIDYARRDCNKVIFPEGRCGIAKNMARSLPKTFLAKNDIDTAAEYLTNDNYSYFDDENILLKYDTKFCIPFIEKICYALIPVD